MEPIVELSVRVASLLAFVRDYVPDVCWMEDAVALGSGRIREAAARDYAVLRTLQELVEPEEHDKDHKGQYQDLYPPQQPGESEPCSEVLGRTYTTKWLKERHISTPQTDEQKRAVLAQLFTGKLQECLKQLQEVLPETFLFKKLYPAPKKAPTDAPRLRWVDVTREEIGEQMANALFAHESLVPKVAQALDYTPQLITELAARKPCVSFRESRRAQDKLLETSRTVLRRYCRYLKIAVPFSFVLSDELEEVRRSRRQRLRQVINQEPRLPEPKPCRPREQAYRDCLFGLALSGGGIRSATFALGVLQGMADRNMLPFIDYLSTVSGGGYIGSWLLAWIKRRGSINAVQESLRGAATGLPDSSSCAVQAKPSVAPPPDVNQNSDPRAEHVRPVRMLREYARYLAPQAGLFSADSWTMLTTWLRNTALNLTVLVSALAVLLLLPRTAGYLLAVLPHWCSWLPRAHALPVLLAGAPLWTACALIGAFNLRPFRYWRNPSDSRTGRGDTESTVVASVLASIVAGAFWLLVALWSFGGYEKPYAAALWSGIIFLLGVTILAFCSIFHAGKKRTLAEPHPVLYTICAFVCAALGGALVYAFCVLFLLPQAEDASRGTWVVITGGLPLVLLTISITVGAMIGILGRTLSDEQREWWSRLGAWLAIFTLAWVFVCLICFFSPLWMTKLWLSAVAGASWVTITATGVKTAFSARSGRNGGDNEQNSLIKAVMNAAPAMFIVGLLSAVSFGLYYGLGRAMEWEALAQLFLPDPFAHQLCCTNTVFAGQKLANHYWALMYPGSPFPLITALGLGGFALLLDWRIDTNEFSMHHFYKNRLVRCYLGASRPRERRWPNAFTDFDMEDDVRLCRFQTKDGTHTEDAWTNCKSGYVGPYPIINTTLNVTRGSDLARQERKGESFIFTPLWSGFDFVRKQTAVPSQSRSEYAFRPTKGFAFKKYGIFLGTAMAISGAAANSNMGFHTSPSLAFLLTVFNVRLGWWIGNPLHRKTWQNPGPTLGLACLGRELTAQTTTNAKYVLLSDGGHFDNMGLYELIRRRCRYIVVSDAEEDTKFKLEGIGGAIRKCRVDFGVVIDLDLEALQPLGDPAKSFLHYSIGTILYPEHLPTSAGKNGSNENPCGVLVYIKASVTGDEPVDVVEFRKRQPQFPHNSTTNQFFDESHFESYRALGHHAAQGIFSADAREVFLQQHGDLCKTLRTIFCKVQKTYRKNLDEVEKKKTHQERQA